MFGAMATSAPKSFADELEKIAARYESQFAGHSRATRNLDELDAILKDTKGILARIESIPSAARGPELSTVGDTARENVRIYEQERGLIVEAKEMGPAFEEFAPLAATANLVFAKYQRHFAGQSRSTRDLGLLGELGDELEVIAEQMEELTSQGAASRMKADLDVVRSSRAMYRKEEGEIKKAHGDGSVDDRVNRLAQLANSQFKLYADHFAGRSRSTRRPALLVRMIATLESYAKEMNKLDGKGGGDTNKKNVGIVETQLATYKAELVEIRKARQGTSFADIMGMLGGAANELFDEYRKSYSGQDRKTRDLELLSRICDDLGDIRRQMTDLSRAESNDMNTGNLAVVTSQLAQFEEEWEAINTAKGPR
ncbi:hypothetical protein BH09MYX1_BH09MYX1_11510 [soil metagenome]